MPLLIGLQAGHEDITHNPDPILAGETGAQGEEPFNVAVRNKLSTILQAYGFAVQLDNANANVDPNTTGKDFAFYLAIHAEGAPAGGIVSAPDASVDSSNIESKRIVAAINAHYFSDTGIAQVPSIVTRNMTLYYMWQALSAKTPCGIIECGDLLDAHDKVILADINRVALGIAHGICAAFNVTWKGDPTQQPAPTPQPTPQPTVDWQGKYNVLNAQFTDYKSKFSQASQDSAIANAIKPLEDKINNAKAALL